MKDFEIIFIISVIVLCILYIVYLFCVHHINTNTTVQSENTFQIVLSEGIYDIRLNGRRLTSKSTLDEAKEWLNKNKNNYLKEDIIVYEEVYKDSI